MKRQRIIGWLLAVGMALSSAACAGTTPDSTQSVGEKNDKQSNETTETIVSKPYGNVNSIEFWTAPNTEKIMSDQYAIYSDLKGDNAIDIKAVRNEYENAQLIMTAGEDVGGYTVTVSDLTTAGGSKIDKSNVTVYNQKYIKITRITTQTSVPLGMYPDGLVEVSLAVKAGENKIEKGKNQGLWISVYVPKDAQAGTYTGEITVTLGNTSHKTPISVEVYDYTLTDEMHQKSSFSITWPYQSGELDSTWECYAAYRDTLLDYRLSTEFWRHGAMSDLETFVDEACDYARDPKKPQILLPYSSGNNGFDKESMKSYVMAFAKRSVADNYDYCAQLMEYFGAIIDEPNPNDASVVAKVKLISASWNEMREEIAAELAADSQFMQSDIASTIIASVLKMPHVIAGNRNVDAFHDVDATWCPTIDYYYGNGRSLYDTQDERWWYTMLVPKPPCPTYHIEDGLTSGRVMSWMQYEYGVVGNLYWAVNDYLDSKMSPYGVEDYYDLFMDGGPANGDGWLFYPGAKYGITGPIPTIRIESIRDGYEEYELLYDLGERYKDISAALGKTYTFNNVINNYAQYLYSGVKVLTSANIFIGARNALLGYCGLAKDDSCFLLDYSVSGATATYTIMAKNGVPVTKNGAQVNASRTVNYKGAQYSIYEIQITDSSTQKIQATVGGYTATLNFMFEGTSYSYAHSDIPSGSISGSGVGVTESTYGGKSVYKISFPDMAENKTQTFTFNMKQILDRLDKTANRLSFDVYAEESVRLSVRFKYKNKSVQYEVYSGDLSVGGNKVEISNLYSFDWATLGNVEYVTFAFGEKGDSARSVYFGDIVLSTVRF